MLLRPIGLSLLVVTAGLAQVRNREAERLLKSLSSRFSQTLGAILPPHARSANVWLVDSVFLESYEAQNNRWTSEELDVFRYYSNNRVQWESLFVWSGSAWRLDSSFQHVLYRTGDWRDLDSVVLAYSPSQNQPAGKQSFTYQDLGGGRVKLEASDSARQGNNWTPVADPGGRAEAWLTRNRLLGTENPWVLQEPHLEDMDFFERAYPFDSVRLYALDQGNWIEVISIKNYFQNGRLDSMYIRFDVGLTIANIARKYSYDANGRLVSRRDTAWPAAGGQGIGHSAGTKVFLYQGNATFPYKDSIALRMYDDNNQRIGTNVIVRNYTYDQNSGKVAVVQRDTCSTANCTPTPELRQRYVYRRVDAPTSLEERVQASGSAVWFVPSPVRGGERVFIAVEVPQAYRLLSVNGQVVLQGELPAGGGWLTLPSAAGVYILQVGAGQQRLLVLP
ncbi:MAG: T9SS type A sorting domain-containing protein [Bacteroidia bacterium]